MVRVDLHVPQSRSLKEKRAALRPIVDTLRHRFGVSVAEVGFQDTWQRARVGFAVVSGTYGHAADVVATIERWIWGRPDVEVAGFAVQWVSQDEE